MTLINQADFRPSGTPGRYYYSGPLEEAKSFVHSRLSVATASGGPRITVRLIDESKSTAQDRGIVATGTGDSLVDAWRFALAVYLPKLGLPLDLSPETSGRPEEWTTTGKDTPEETGNGEKDARYWITKYPLLVGALAGMRARASFHSVALELSAIAAESNDELSDDEILALHVSEKAGKA